jgi:hypothetical protein
MKRRFIAIFVALAMAFSVAAMTGCDPQDSGGGGNTTTSATTAAGGPTDPECECEDGCDECADATGENEIPDCDWGVGCLKCKECIKNLAASEGFNTDQGEQGERTLLNIYTFTDETVDMLKFFLDANPTFTDDYFIQVHRNTAATPHRLAVNTNINREGENSVDLFVADVDYAREFAANPHTATLDELGIDITESEYYAYTLELMRINGELKGLSHQATPGAMYFRADIAEEVLGVDNVEDMQALVKDWDTFLETAQKLMDEKGGEDGKDFSIIAGADELKRNFMNAREEGWVVMEDGKETFNIDDATITEFVNVTGAIRDMDGLKIQGSAQWSGDWFSGMDDGSVFAYFGSTWFLHYTLGDNTDKSDGKWGMVPGPQEFYWGGTYWFGSKNAAADEAKKAGVAQIIEFFCVNDESITEYMKDTGDFTSKKSVADAIKSDSAFENDFFLWNTNHYEIFADIADRIDITKNITMYDETVNSVFDAFINDVFSNGDTQEVALGKLRETVRERLAGSVVVP